ncbi:beta-1,3-galactosyltransferase 1-like [Ornithodoros turicata]|uniref:beta-1,3-galactosyltransferase 1-like n=1 Tax=Ornithodoros turicata TaxID=34597 RepID=UPI00313891C1
MIQPVNGTRVRCKCFFCVILFLGVALYVFWQRTLHHPTASHRSDSLRLTSTSPGRAKNTSVVNPHPYMFVINKPKLCETPGEVLVLVCVFTASTHFERRIAIRATWGKASLERGFKVAFFVGLPKYKSVQSLIEAENTIYEDIIQGNFADTYHNVTLKSIMVVRWITEYCSKAKFVLKIDDDMMLNASDLWEEVTTSLRNFTMTAWGILDKDSKPHRNPLSKWYLPPSMYKSEVLPDFLVGSAYMFTGDCVPLLYNLSFTIPPLWLEDVYITGMVAKKAGVRLVYHVGFPHKYSPFKPCSRRRQITSHYQTATSMLEFWKQMPVSQPGFRCNVTTNGTVTTLS